MLVNGVLSDSINAADRGLLYGDGVFRTLRIRAGRPQHWSRHYRKLQQDCTALALPCPDGGLLLEELQRLVGQQSDAVAKIIVTRGQGERGYAPPAKAAATRILSLSPAPAYPQRYYAHGVRLRLCELRLAHQPRLAGIKHLNRLEHVLAAAEWDDAEIAEGVLLDVAGHVVEATRSNLFMLRGDTLLTPDLGLCGVSGMQRERVLEWAARSGMACEIGSFALADLLRAEEVFLVNSVIGLWPVRELEGRIWQQHPLSLRIQEWLDDAHD
jgi:4-amino-4-deoxychorismate lyase